MSLLGPPKRPRDAWWYAETTVIVVWYTFVAMVGIVGVIGLISWVLILAKFVMEELTT